MNSEQPQPRRSKFQQAPRKSVKGAAKPVPSKRAPSVNKEKPAPAAAPPPLPLKPKPMDVSNGKALYAKYAKCFYNSVSLGKWVEATVIMVNENGEIMIDTKEEYWFSVQEQQEKFRACAS